MPTWKRAYPTVKVKKLNAALKTGFRATIPESDLAAAIQASSSFKDLGQRLKELYAIAADLDDLIKLCEKNLQ